MPLSPESNTVESVGATLEMNCSTSRIAALAHHVVLDIEVGNQPLIFAYQPFDVARVFDGDGGDGGNGRHELQMVFVKKGVGLFGVEINNSQRALQHDERHAQNRSGPVRHQTVGRREVLRFRLVGNQERFAVMKNPLRKRCGSL